jgi:DNA-binding beta-propeller fold protein YncE
LNSFLPLGVVLLHSENIHLVPQRKDLVVCAEFTVHNNNRQIAEVVAYREHGHLNARMFYTDVFRNGKIRVGRIGERSAQDAQIYYHVKQDKPTVYIRSGDILRLTCHYNTMDRNTVIGYSVSELQGEMCNQYLMGTVNLAPNDRGQSCNANITTKWESVGKVLEWENMPNFGEIASLALVPLSGGIGGSVATAAEPQNLWVFHRSNYNFWNKNLIVKATIVSLKGQNFGKNQFIVPHGLYLDKWGFLWATDIVLHQVFRIRASTGETVLTLGTFKTPGSDGTHFNQPTDVALSPDGLYAYISDGYGNSRVVVFVARDAAAVSQKNGADNSSAYVFSHSWGSFGRKPGQFDTPHSIAVDGRGRVYVADRHNARVQVFTPGTSESKSRLLAVWQAPINRVIPWASLSPAQQNANVDHPWLYHVTALCYEPFLDVLFIIEGDNIVMRSVGGDEMQRINNTALEWPHDIEATVSFDGKYVDVYVAELTGKNIIKYQMLL